MPKLGALSCRSYSVVASPLRVHQHRSVPGLIPDTGMARGLAYPVCCRSRSLSPPSPSLRAACPIHAAASMLVIRYFPHSVFAQRAASDEARCWWPDLNRRRLCSVTGAPASSSYQLSYTNKGFDCCGNRHRNIPSADCEFDAIKPLVDDGFPISIRSAHCPTDRAIT